MESSFLPVYKLGLIWIEARKLPGSAQHSCIHWVTCQEAAGKKSNSSCCFVFLNKLMAFHFFLSSTVTTVSRTSSDLWLRRGQFYMDVFEIEYCPTGRCPSWSHFAAGRTRAPAEVGHVPLSLHYWHCWLSRQSSLGSRPSLRAWIRASQLAARQVRGMFAQAASHHFVGAVHVCGLCS